MVYVYAVTDDAAGPVPREGPGLEEQDLRIVASSALAAIVSDHRGRLGSPSEADLWTHERVVEGVMADRAVLPMRFGSLLADDAAVRELLHARRAELATGLRRVAGAIELGVRAAWSSDAEQRDRPPQDRASGSDYLLGLVDRRQRARDLAERIDPPLARLARASRCRLLLTPNLPVSGAYLVDRERLDAFRVEIAELDEQIGHAEIMCTGPWPPYSFAAPSHEGA